MFRKFTLSLLVAAIAILVFAVAVSAQGRAQGRALGRTGFGNGPMNMTETTRNWQFQGEGAVAPQRLMNQSCDGTCVNFVDEDGDGLCDNCGQQVGVRSMDGNARGRMAGGMRGAGYHADGESLHQFGDGTCDYEIAPQDGTGNQYGRGGQGS